MVKFSLVYQLIELKMMDETTYKILYKVPLTYKTLKVIRYLVNKGDVNFRQMLQKKDRLIKEATGASGPRDPIHGSSLYAAIRNEAKELLDVLFEDFSDAVVPDINKTRAKGVQISGMGSQAQKGKYEGFGNAPTASNKTIVDKVVGTLADMVEKILNTPDKDTEAIANALEVDSGGYLAVKAHPTQCASNEINIEPLCNKPKSRPLNSIQRSYHTPGRAGGGWEDDDVLGTTQQSVYAESAEMGELKTESEVVGEDLFSAEEQLVDEIVCSEKPLTSWQEIDSICKMCATLNCEHILELFVKRLSTDNNLHKMQILTILEALLYQDIAQLESLCAIFHEVLHKISTKTESKEIEMKSKKLSLTLEKLLVLQFH